MRPRAAWPAPRGRRDHALGLFGQILWAPFVAFGALCAASIWLIVIGVPLLLVVLPAFLACNERRCGRRPAPSLLVAGLAAIPVLDASALVAVVYADGGPAARLGLAALAFWSVAATITLLRMRRPPPRWHGEPEALGLWLQVLWIPMAVALIWPALMLFGVPFLLLALAPCYAGRLRHQRRFIPVQVTFISSLAVTTWSAVAVGASIGQGRWLVGLLTLGVLMLWIVPAVVTNVLLWRRRDE
ncbi:MAG: hypothetical protein ACRDZ2_11805 [Ilumatobacteraceae bacterium]